MGLLNINIKKCNKCNKQLSFSQKEFCDSCFIKVFEKRIRKHLRQLPFEKLENIVVVDKVCEYLIKKIITAPIQISPKKNKNRKTMTMAPITTDDAVESLLNYYFTGKKQKNDRLEFPLLEPITHEELKRFCQLKSLPYTKKQTSIGKFLSTLEAKYPGTKHALYSTVQELRKQKFYK